MRLPTHKQGDYSATNRDSAYVRSHTQLPTLYSVPGGSDLERATRISTVAVPALPISMPPNRIIRSSCRCVRIVYVSVHTQVGRVVRAGEIPTPNCVLRCAYANVHPAF